MGLEISGACPVLDLLFRVRSPRLLFFGTVATAVRTPTSGMAWDQLLSFDAWQRLFREHSLCQVRDSCCVSNIVVRGCSLRPDRSSRGNCQAAR